MADEADAAHPGGAAAILAAYDGEERIAPRPVGLTREETPYVVRHLRGRGHESTIAYARLDETNADAVIEGEIEHFRSLGRPFEWKHFEHDGPADLLARLERAGFAIGPAEMLMVVDLADLPAAVGAPGAHEVRHAEGADDRAWDDFLSVVRAASPEHAEAVEREVLGAWADGGDRVEAYVAYLNGEPVSAGRLTLTAGSSFAGLYGGATLPHARGRGLYRSLVAARVQAARSHGRRWAHVDAGPMSAPILHRLGFATIGTTRPCGWRPV